MSKFDQLAQTAPEGEPTAVPPSPEISEHRLAELDDDPKALILLTILDEECGHWYPRTRTPREVGRLYEMAHYGADVGEFRLWDVDSDGVPQPCEVHWEPRVVAFGNDYATHHGKVCRADTGEYVNDVYMKLDLRA